jgi:succinoglycan biosynthesis protein ExoM
VKRRIAICVATYQRPHLLDQLLDSLGRLEIPADTTVEIRIVDNDAAGTARDVVDRHAGSPALAGRVIYRVEPMANIAHARNRAVQIGPADLILFVDDDETIDPRCLCELVVTLDLSGADAVIGFVGAVLPPRVPDWIRRGAFFDHPTGPDGQPLHWRGTRCGCTLVRGWWFYEREFRFDPSYGRSGGEDVDLFARMHRHGARFTSNSRAVALETIPPDRARLRWLWRRHWRCGLCYQRLVQHEERSRHPAVVFGGRCARSFWRTLMAVPPLLAGRPEAIVRAILGFSLAGGGLTAWLRPTYANAHACYGTAPSPATNPQGG